MAAMAAYENNITEIKKNHERNIIIYVILIVLIKQIKQKIDKIFNDVLREYKINESENTEELDKHKKMFNKFVENLPDISKIRIKYKLDDNDVNFSLLDKTIQRTIAQIEQIILDFQLICKKYNLGGFSEDLSKIRDDFIKQVNSIRRPEAGKIKKKRNQKKEKQKTKKENKKKQKKKTKRNQTKREIKPNKKKPNKKKNKTKKK